jgi:hypothetical protein
MGQHARLPPSINGGFPTACVPLQTVKSFAQNNATVDNTEYDIYDPSIYSTCTSAYQLAGVPGSCLMAASSAAKHGMCKPLRRSLRGHSVAG